MDKNMETIQKTKRSLTKDRAASFSGILLVLTAFIAPLMALPWIAIASLPKLSSVVEASPTAILLTALVSLCFIGFSSSVVSIAASFINRHEAHSSLPLKTLVLQSFCLVFSIGAFLFLR